MFDIQYEFMFYEFVVICLFVLLLICIFVSVVILMLLLLVLLLQYTTFFFVVTYNFVILSIYNSILTITYYRSTSPPGGNQVDGLPPALRRIRPGD